MHTVIVLYFSDCMNAQMRRWTSPPLVMRKQFTSCLPEKPGSYLPFRCHTCNNRHSRLQIFSRNLENISVLLLQTVVPNHPNFNEIIPSFACKSQCILWKFWLSRSAPMNMPRSESFLRMFKGWPHCVHVPHLSFVVTQQLSVHVYAGWQGFCSDLNVEVATLP